MTNPIAATAENTATASSAKSAPSSSRSSENPDDLFGLDEEASARPGVADQDSTAPPPPDDPPSNLAGAEGLEPRESSGRLPSRSTSSPSTTFSTVIWPRAQMRSSSTKAA